MITDAQQLTDFSFFYFKVLGVKTPCHRKQNNIYKSLIISKHIPYTAKHSYKNMWNLLGIDCHENMLRYNNV